MTIVHKAVTRLTLDLQLGDVQKSFGLTKGDRNRRLEITFTDGGRPFELPSKWVVWLLATKPDGARVEMPCVVEHGRATFDLEDGYELATCPGMFAVWFKILADTGEDVAGPAVWCHVKDGPGEVESLSQDGIDEYLLGLISANAEDIAEKRGDIDLLMETTDNLGEAQRGLQETVRAHGKDINTNTTAITLLQESVTRGGTIVIPTTAWTSEQTTIVQIELDGSVLNSGTLMVIAPANDATKKIVAEYGMSMVIDKTSNGPDSGSDAVVFERKAGKIPETDLTFRYAVITVDTSESAPSPTVTLVGGLGGGVGGSEELYVGSDEPRVNATVWIDPSGDPTNTETWEFEMENGDTVTKELVVVAD